MSRTVSLFLGFVVCFYLLAVKAQADSRNTPSTKRARQSATVNSTTDGALQDTEERMKDTEERMIVGRIATMERQLKKAENELNRQLVAAQRVRQRGVSENNRDLLKQAEQIELHALNRYEQWINYMDRFGAQLNTSTKTRADSLSQSAAKRSRSASKKTRVQPLPTQRKRQTTRRHSPQTRRYPPKMGRYLPQTRRHPQETQRRYRGTQWGRVFRRN